MILSVIVPVYNAEKYLDECVQSILAQTFAEFELILVNDGSTDRSGAMCDQWALKDSRISVLHQSNAGQSAARQNGIRAARGEFVAFVDSDDKIEPRMYETLLTAQRQYNSDYVICGLKRFFTENDTGRLEPAGDFVAGDPAQIKAKLILPMVMSLPGEGFVSQSSVKNLFRKAILDQNGIEFKSLNRYFSEDLMFNIEYLLHCQTAVSVPDELYCYRANYESYSNTFRTSRDRFCSIVNLHLAVKQLVGSGELLDVRLSVRSLETISVFLRHVLINDSFADAYRFVDEICKNKDVQSFMNFRYEQLSVKNRLMQGLIRGRHTLLLCIMIKIYNLVYIKK